MEAPRIVSLLPAATEIICALGLGQHMVGRSHECDYPSAIRHIPICSRSKLIANRDDSPTIHANIKSLLGQALAIYAVDMDLLRTLRPTHIITQHQCSVCAVSVKDVRSALNDWLENAPVVMSLAPNNLHDVFDDILRIGVQLDATFPAENLVGSCLGRMNQIAARGRDTRQKPTVACIEWTEPLMVAGYWIPQLVIDAGGQPLLAEAGQHGPLTSLENLLDLDPDLILAMPCGFNLVETRRAIQNLSQHPNWQQLRAVRQQKVFLTDAHQYFNRPGPRIVESLEILGEILHPQAFDFGHAGKGWQPF